MIDARPIRIFLVDDHKICLEGLARLIQDEPTMQIVGTATDGREAIRQVEALQPDVVLMDISMPNLNGIEATRMIHKVSKDARVLILSMHDNEAFLKRALEAGASGYLMKDTTANELFTAIREVYQGNVYLSPSISRKLILDYLEVKNREDGDPLKPSLTVREREVLQLIAEGHSHKTVAQILNISPMTVQTHRKQIMKKLNLHRAGDLIRYAIQNGITHLTPT